MRTDVEELEKEIRRRKKDYEELESRVSALERKVWQLTGGGGARSLEAGAARETETLELGLRLFRLRGSGHHELHVLTCRGAMGITRGAGA